MVRDDKALLTAAIVEWSLQYAGTATDGPRAFLGKRVNAKRVERIWRREGLKALLRRRRRTTDDRCGC